MHSVRLTVTSKMNFWADLRIEGFTFCVKVHIHNSISGYAIDLVWSRERPWASDNQALLP